jgi:predicted lipoprotein
MPYRILMKKLSFAALALALLAALSLSGCVLATVRTLDEDEEAKAGFDPEAYVENIWEERVLPTYQEDAQDMTTLLDLLNTDEPAAVDQYGHRSGTGAYSFMVRGEGTIVDFDTSSRAGLAAVDLAPTDGTPDVNLTIGPLIKISQRASVRDAVGFIEYGDFVNQQEFAGVANAMGERITVMIADRLGAESVDAISDLDPASIEGKSVTFIGAFSLDAMEDMIVVPVILEVND